MSAQELTVKIGGLATDPNPNLTDVGQAAIAENIWFRHHGEASPRPAFGDTNLAASMTSRCYDMYFFDDNVYGYTDGNTQTSTTSALRNFTDNVNVELRLDSGSTTHMQFFPAFHRSETFQAALYLPTQNGIARLAESSATTFLAGLPKPPVGEVQSVGTPTLEASKNYAYRITIVETIGDQEFESEPSERFYASTGAGLSTGATKVKFSAPVTATDRGAKIRIYRSKGVATGSIPSDELFLSMEVTPSTTAAGDWISYTDGTPESDLTLPLYTNGGNLSKAKTCPPKARVLKEFNSMMFYANVDEFPAVEVQGWLPGAGAGLPNDVGDFTSGNSAIASMSTNYQAANYNNFFISTTGNYPGASSTHLPAWTYQESGAAGSITASANALATGSRAIGWWADTTLGPSFLGVDFTFWLTAAGGFRETGSSTARVAADAGSVYNGTTSVNWYDSAIMPSKGNIAAHSLAFVLGTYKNVPVVITPTTPTDTTLPHEIDFVGGASGYYRVGFIASPTRPGNSISVSSSLFTYSPTTTSQVFTQYGSRLYFSEVLEPEAVPALNFVEIGNRSEQILGLGRTRDSLFVFKEDGTWRVTGTSPDDISVSEYDRSLRLVHPNCITELNNTIYAWTNQGLCKVDEVGWEAISDGAIDISLDDGARNLTASLSSSPCGLYALPHEDYLILGYADAAADSSPDTFYCYSVKTGQWSTWDFDSTNTSESINGFADSPRNRAIYAFGNRTDTDVPLVITGLSQSMTSEDSPGYLQRCSYFIGSSVTTSITTINTNADGSIQFHADTTGWEVGMGVSNTAVASMFKGVVRSVSADPGIATVVPMTGTPGPFANPAVATTTRYKPFKCTYKALPRSAQNMGIVKEWLDVSPVFGTMQGVQQVTIGMQSDTNDTSSVVTATFNALDAGDQVRAVRTSIDRDHAYADEISPSIVITSSAGQWRMKGISYTYRPVSTRIDSRE